MKKIMMVAMTVIVAISSVYAADKDVYKERQAIRKMAKSELTAKSSKEAKKGAKEFIKEGWKVNPGALPIEKQLEKSYLMQYEYDESMFPKYIMGEARSVGENYDAAKMAATSLAITNLAGNIQTEVTGMIDNEVDNGQLSKGDAASMTETVSRSKNLISQSIGRTIPVMEIYRINSKKNYEVLVRIAYNAEMAKEAAKKAVREDLKKKGSDLSEKLDKLLGI